MFVNPALVRVAKRDAKTAGVGKGRRDKGAEGLLAHAHRKAIEKAPKAQAKRSARRLSQDGAPKRLHSRAPPLSHEIGGAIAVLLQPAPL